MEAYFSHWDCIYSLLTLVQRPFIKKWIKFYENRAELMAKTIRSHPTSPPRTNLLDCSHIFKKWPLNGLTFSSFPDLPTGKKTGLQRKKDAHGPSLHIRFLSTCDFWYGIYHHLSMFSENITFLKLCHILIILCISDSKMADPPILISK